MLPIAWYVSSMDLDIGINVKSGLIWYILSLEQKNKLSCAFTILSGATQPMPVFTSKRVNKDGSPDDTSNLKIPWS